MMSRCILLLLLLFCGPLSFAQDDGADTNEGTEEVGGADEEEAAVEEAVEPERFYDENGERLSAEDEAEKRRAAREVDLHRIEQQQAYDARLESQRKRNYLMLAALALLLFWLLTKQNSGQQHSTAQRRADRKAPVSPQELARAVFEVARDGNIDAYRGLFLTGGEANRVLGLEAAEQYLARRTSKALEDALVNMAVQVPPNAVFVGVEEVSEGSFAMKLNVDARTTALVPIGKAVKVGAIYRLAELPN